MNTIRIMYLRTTLIHLKRILAVTVLILSPLFITGCGGSDKTAEEDSLYTEILNSDHMPVDEAYEQLKNSSSTDPEQTAFIQRLKDLNECSDDTGRRIEFSGILAFLRCKLG